MRSPGRQQYYDPFIEGEAPDEELQIQLRGIAVGSPGTYILFEDFVDAIRSFAYMAEDSKRQQAIYELISWLESTFAGEAPEEEIEDTNIRGKIFNTSAASRIELYPDSDRKWHARLVTKEGLVLREVNDGSFDRSWVEKDAAEKHPDLEMVQLESEEEDSTWTGKGPSKRLWGR